MTLFRTYLILLMLSISMHTYAQERIALVIGNANYQISPLDNPINDAKNMASTLKGLDFKVTLVEDANQQTMEEAIASFGEKLNKDTVGLFYYSGHAIQHNGSNYLIPIGAMSKVKKSSHLKYKTVPSGLVLDEIEQSQSKLNFVFLDACRNSPFRGFSRGISPGLVKTESSQGTLISYSTAPGKVASDGVGKNSPYTKHLISQITKPNIQVELMLKEVNAAVLKATNGEQSPWYESSISGKFCFKAVNGNCGKAIAGILDGIDDIETVDYPDGSSYYGQIKNNTHHGKGVFTNVDGYHYEGDWKDGKSHGKGIVTWVDGTRYKGEFKNGKKHGKGVYDMSDGDRYEGEYKNNKRHGKGIFTQKNSNRYEGEWKDDQLHKGIFYKNKKSRYHEYKIRYEGKFENLYLQGRGIETWTNDSCLEKNIKIFDWSCSQNGKRYEGEFKDGVRHGKGIETWADGTRYEGDFKDGKEHGKGIETWKNGSRYNDELKNNKESGKGIYTKLDGNNRYEGEYRNGAKHGEGILSYVDGGRYEGEWYKGERVSIVDIIDYIEHEADKTNNIHSFIKNLDNIKTVNYSDDSSYYGQIKNNKRHGKGAHIRKDSDGSHYEGEFKNNKEHGKGTQTWAYGHRYEGEYKNGVRHGKGVYTFAKLSIKKRYEGEFKDGKIHGKGVLIYTNGDRYKGEFSDDIPHGIGVMVYENGNKYKGELKDDEFNGKGIYTWANGDRYEGEYKNGVKHGKGVETFTDGGFRYEGEFKNNVRHGKGIFTTENGYRYEGGHKNGNRYGKFVITGIDGYRFEGDGNWKGGRNGKHQFYGKGIQTLADGARYKGEFEDGLKHGKGVLIWGKGEQEGDKYEGDFKDGKEHGKGVYTSENGTSYEGEWINGKKVEK